MDLHAQTDIPYIAHCHGQQLEVDLRQFLKQQTTIRHHHTWTSQKRVKRAIGDLEDTDWPSALSIIHNNRPVHTFFSSRKDTTLRTQHVKKLHGTMATPSMMHARHPDLYPDDLCALCRLATEDNEHIWTCPRLSRTHNQQRIIWEEAVAAIPKWGRATVHKVNADSQLRYTKVAKRDLTATPPTPLQWYQPDETLVWGFSLFIL